MLRLVALRSPVLDLCTACREEVAALREKGVVVYLIGDGVGKDKITHCF
jgi:hypothetical protein